MGLLKVCFVWKVCIVLAIAAGIGAYALGASQSWSAAIGLLAPALPTFLRGAVRGVRTPSDRERPGARHEAMSGVDF